MVKDSIVPPLHGMSLVTESCEKQAASAEKKDEYFSSLEFSMPEVTFEELFLSEEQRDFFSSIVVGHRNADRLTSLGLSPVMRVLLSGDHGTGRTAVCCALAAELDMTLAFIHAEYIAVMPEALAMRRFTQDLDQVAKKASTGNQHILLVIENLETVIGACQNADSSPLLCHMVRKLKELSPGMMLVATAGSRFAHEECLMHVFENVISMEPPVLSQRQGIISSLAKRWHLPPVLNYELLAKFTEGISFGELINIMTEAARHHAISDDLTNADITALILKRRLKYTSAPEKAIAVVTEMLDRGVSLRTAASALGISHSTLDYQVQKYRASIKEDESLEF